MRGLLIATACLTLFANDLHIDDLYDDWRSGEPAAQSDTGLLRALWLADDGVHLVLRVDLAEPLLAQEENALELLLDLDADSATGETVAGLGVDLRWRFGHRKGTDARGNTLRRAELGLWISPSVVSDTFEVLIKREQRLGDRLLFNAPELQLALRHGDEVLGPARHPLKPLKKPTPVRLNLDKRVGHVRLLAYNIEFDGLLNAEAKPALTRVLQALDPQVIGVQEVYNSSASDIAVILDDILPGPKWHTAKHEPDLVMASRFPIKAHAAIKAYDFGGAASYLLDTEETLGADLLYVLAHLTCCNKPHSNRERQSVCDAIIRYLDEVRHGRGPFRVTARTPIIIGGDMNFVGDPKQPHTLSHGLDQAPDWDGTPFIDPRPAVTGLPMTFTWYRPGSSFAPARLDYVFYSDSVLELGAAFALHTPTMHSDDRARHGLQKDDSVKASDHLPLVIDIHLKEP